MSRYSYGFKPYVPVAERRRKAERHVAKLTKKGKAIHPVRIEGRTIARTFWGKAWCENLESYMDFANRLPRGRAYVRNGSVANLDIQAGGVEAIVAGSEVYQVKVSIKPAVKARWKRLCRECAGGIGSLVELLQGRFSEQVMAILTRRETGLFPSPNEIEFKCSCPDWATMCKHVAAALYGVGARLDQHPELLFTLRSVDQEELISHAASGGELAGKQTGAGPELDESELSDVFGIELDTAPPPSAPASRKKAKRKAKKPSVAKKKSKSKRKATKTIKRKANKR